MRRVRTSGRAGEPDEVWRRYFETLGEAARSGLFDILAHPDLVKVWGAGRPLPDGDLRRFYELGDGGDRRVGRGDRGLHRGAAQAGRRDLPGAGVPGDVPRRRRPLALSSDAHVPDQLGYGYEQALELLGALGVTEIAVFERRERRLEPLG